MSGSLHLSIVTPSARLVDTDAAVSVRAEDESGGFGIMPGHADFLTALTPSLVRWRNGNGVEHFCVVDGGILTVRGGRDIAIACRQGKVGDDMDRLNQDIAAMRAEQADAARNVRVEQTQLHARAVRQLMRLIQGDGDEAFANSMRRELGR